MFKSRARHRRLLPAALWLLYVPIDTEAFADAIAARLTTVKDRFGFDFYLYHRSTTYSAYVGSPESILRASTITAIKNTPLPASCLPR